MFKFLAENNELRPLPYLSCADIRGKGFNLVNVKDCLYGMAYEKECQDSLDEESHNGVWSKMLTIGPIDLQEKYWLLSQCFKNGGEILINKCGSFSLYDPEISFRRCYSYTPSLVCVQGMESDAALFISGKTGEVG